jgi:UPF0755 protein
VKALGLALGGLLSSALIALLIGWRMFLTYVGSPSGTSEKEVIVEVPKDITPASLAQKLEKQGLISRANWFEIYLERFRTPATLHPGEYALRPTMSPAEIVSRLDRGTNVSYPISVQPGARALDVVHKMVDLKLGKEEELSVAIRDPALAKELGVPADRLEGWLFPDDYSFTRGLSASDIFKRMVDRFRARVSQDLVKSSGLSEPQLVTLASLVECDNVPAAQRGLLAAMYRNRLDRGMKLESKASVAYGVDKAIDKLTEQDYQSPHPFNTFVHTGLPPGPIASPSLASLNLVAHPPKSDALYFGTRSDGTHAFCPDEDCLRAITGRPGKAPRRGP